jgi:hypothetical protein
MDAGLTINLADHLFEIADRLKGAEDARRSQPEPERSRRPTRAGEAAATEVRPSPVTQPSDEGSTRS